MGQARRIWQQYSVVSHISHNTNASNKCKALKTYMSTIYEEPLEEEECIWAGEEPTRPDAITGWMNGYTYICVYVYQYV